MRNWFMKVNMKKGFQTKKTPRICKLYKFKTKRAQQEKKERKVETVSLLAPSPFKPF